MTELLFHTGGDCSNCGKPMMPYDNMATSMQAKMDFIDLVNEQQAAEDGENDEWRKILTSGV